MSWQFRRSVRLMPGVRLNLTKNGIGLGFGGHGARFSMHSTGRRTVSYGIPGSGLYWTKSWQAGQSASSPLTAGSVRSTDGSTSPAPSTVLRSLAETADALSPLEGAEVVAVELRRLENDLMIPRSGSPATRGGAVAADPEPLDVSGLRAVLHDTSWRNEGQLVVGLQPMTGFEVVVPLDPVSLALLAACHLLAAGREESAKTLLAGLPPRDEVMLVRAAALMHAGRPAAVLALGLPALDGHCAWLSALIRAEALRRCCRPSEALNLLGDLEGAATRLKPPLPTETLEVLDVARAATNLDLGRSGEALAILIDVLKSDPLDAAALRELQRAQEMEHRSPRSEVRVAVDDPEAVRALTIAVESLQAEVLGARDVLDDLVEELAEVDAEYDRVTGEATMELTRLKAVLAQRIASATGQASDQEIAERAQAEHQDRAKRSKQHKQRKKEEAVEAGLGANADPELKRLYRKLVRRWHPDSSNEQHEQALRTDMTARINVLYGKRDLAGLQELLDAEATTMEADSSPSNATIAELAVREQQLRKELTEVRDEIGRLLRSPIERLRLDRQAAAATGRDLFAELLEVLRSEILEIRENLEQLERTADQS